MSIEKMWRNDEMTNFGIFTQPIPMFFFCCTNLDNLYSADKAAHFINYFKVSRKLFIEVQNWESQDSTETAAHVT